MDFNILTLTKPSESCNVVLNTNYWNVGSPPTFQVWTLLRLNTISWLNIIRRKDSTRGRVHLTKLHIAGA